MTNTSEVNGEILWGINDTIHKIQFKGVVDLDQQKVESLKCEMGDTFLDDVLQGVFVSAGQEALRLANVK
jgi:hypothetical protein